MMDAEPGFQGGKGASTRDVVIVGAGPAGLALAYELKRAGIRPRVLDRADEVASSWRGRHEELRLNTHRRVSHQPGAPIPPALGPFPARDDYIAYLETYAAGLGVPLELGVHVQRVERGRQSRWLLSTTDGDVAAAHVIIATGSDRLPRMPAWPGRETFTGEIIHAGRFRHADYYAGRRVLLVGAGNSGVDIGNHLSRAAVGPSWVSIRNGPNIAPQYAFGVPAQLLVARLRWLPVRCQDAVIALVGRLVLGDLTRLGVPPAPKGAVTRLNEDGVTLAVDNGFVAALRAGRFEVVQEIARFERDVVHLVDGRMLRPDAVICATGYRLGLRGLVGHLGVLDRGGRPRRLADRPYREHPGLWFLGQNSSLYGNMNIRRGEARRLARRIAGDP